MDLLSTLLFETWFQVKSPHTVIVLLGHPSQFKPRDGACVAGLFCSRFIIFEFAIWNEEYTRHDIMLTTRTSTHAHPRTHACTHADQGFTLAAARLGRSKTASDGDCGSEVVSVKRQRGEREVTTRVRNALGLNKQTQNTKSRTLLLCGTSTGRQARNKAINGLQKNAM